jgi:hypothetical protein
MLTDALALVLSGDYVGGSFNGLTEEDSPVVGALLAAHDVLNAIVPVVTTALVIFLVGMLAFAAIDWHNGDIDNDLGGSK